MKTLTKIFLLLAFVHGFVILLPINTTAELIEPTRSLDKDSEKIGTLSVFSEPPEQEVWLDKEMIGLTPIVEHRVDVGVYILKISDTETEIKIAPNQSLRLSIFKDKLLVIPESELAPPTHAESATEDEQQVGVSAQNQEPGKALQFRPDPFYWPQNPTGPIY